MTKREAWILRGFLALGAALTALTLKKLRKSSTKSPFRMV